MRCSVIIPTYNESGNILNLITEIRSKVNNPEIIIVDDSSPDGTAEIVKETRRRTPRVKVVKRKNKLGVGSAVYYGYLVSSGKEIIFMDADFSHNPDDLPKVLEELQSEDIVLCSRFVEKGKFEQDLLRSKGTMLLGYLLRKVVGTSVLDLTNGFLGVRRGALEKILSFYKNIGIDPFIDLYQFPLVVAAEKLSLNIIEIPTTYSRRKTGDSKINSTKTTLETAHFLFSIMIARLMGKL